MKYFENISIHTFDKARWVVTTVGGENYLINENTFVLISLLNESTSLQEARQEFNRKFESNLSTPMFEDLVSETTRKLMNPHGLAASMGKRKHYLSLRIELLKASFIGVLAQKIAFAFKPVNFLIMSGICVSIVTCFLFVGEKQPCPMIGNDVLLFTGLIWASLFVHELGHIGACRCFGIKHGGVGFGFYFIIPVVYADITQIWTASKSQRIITNLGGIFLEMVYASILCSISLFSENMISGSAGVLIFFKAMTELNPFVRFDGYWLLCDITDTPNLMDKANQAIKSCLKKTAPASAKELLIFIYGLVNHGVVFVYAVYVVTRYFDAVTGFPLKVVQLIVKAFELEVKISDFNREMILVILFYVLMCKMIFKGINFLTKKQLSPGKLSE
jgi:putative peptide zinc metalloprotease protein